LKGFTRDNKFIPMTDYKKVTRKSRDQKANTQGVVIRKARTLTIPKLHRRIEAEEPPRVKFWAENKKGTVIASLIQSKDFDDEMEIRISGFPTMSDKFAVRGHKSIMDQLSFDQFLDKVNLHLERETLMRKKREPFPVGERRPSKLGEQYWNYFCSNSKLSYSDAKNKCEYDNVDK